MTPGGKVKQFEDDQDVQLRDDKFKITKGSFELMNKTSGSKLPPLKGSVTFQTQEAQLTTGASGFSPNKSALKMPNKPQNILNSLESHAS